MAEQVGSIVYTVEADTAQMIKAEAVVNKSIQSQVQQFDKADKAVREYIRTQEDLGRTINAMGQVVNKNGRIVADATIRYRSLAGEAQNMFDGLNTRVTGTAQAVNGQLNQALTNTSYQIQDIAVQLAGGQSPFLVIAQQIPQMLVGFGAMAAGAGAAVAVLGGLYMVLGDTATNMDKLQSSIEQVQAVITIGADGVANYTEEMDKLRNISKAIADAKLQVAINAANDALRSGAAAIKESFDDAGTIFSNSIETIAKETGIGIEAIKQLDTAVRLLGTNPSAEQLKRLEDAISAVTNSSQGATSEGKKLLATLVEQATQTIQSRQYLDSLNEAIANNGEISKEAESKTNDYLNALTAQEIELRLGERAAFAFSLALKGLTADEYNATLAAYDRVEALKTEREEGEKLLDQFAEFEQWDEKQRQSRERAKGQAEGFATGVINRGMSEPERFAAELERLTELREQGLLNEDLYNQAIVASAEQRAQRLEEIAAQEEALRHQQNSMILGSASDLFGGIADIMKNAKGEQSSAYKAFFALSKGFAIAQAGLNLSTAISNALALPFPVNIPAMAQAAAAGTSLLSTISGSQYAGAREFGGPVTAGKSYLVGERGPEIFTPGMGGGITSNKDLMSGGGVNVNVYNYGNDNVQVKQNGRDVDIIIKQAVGAVAGQISSGQGPVGKALKSVGVKPSAVGG